MAVTESPLSIKPRPNVMYGLTHDDNGATVVRVPRAVKIGIGLPAGKDVELYIEPNGRWVARVPGLNEKGGVIYDNKEAMQRNWPGILREAKERGHPKKIDYFTFTRPGATEYDPDFDMIEAHGSKPTEIDIQFVENEPLDSGYQWWTKSELKCHGDGKNALRVLALAQGEEETALAADASAAGMDRFPIIEGCASRGCPYADDPCKPTSVLRFQLLARPRLGATAYFHSTSKRTAMNLSTALHVFRTLTGNGDPARGFVAGIPLTMVLRRHKVSVKTDRGVTTGTAFNVALEFRAEAAPMLKRNLIEAAASYAGARMPDSLPALSAPAASEEESAGNQTITASVQEADEEYIDLPASAIADEFFPQKEAPGDTKQPSAEPDYGDEDPGVVALWSSVGRSITKIGKALLHWRSQMLRFTDGNTEAADEILERYELDGRQLTQDRIDNGLLALREMFLWVQDAEALVTAGIAKEPADA